MKTMFPVCSAAPSCYSTSLISSYIHGIGCSAQKLIVKYRGLCCNQDVLLPHEASFKIHAAKSLNFPMFGSIDQAGSMDSSIFSRYPDDLDDIVRDFSNEFDSELDKWSPSIREINGLYHTDSDILVSSTVSGQPSHVFVGDSMLDGDSQQDALLHLHDSFGETSNLMINSASSGSESVPSSLESIATDNTAALRRPFETVSGGEIGISERENSIENLLSGIHESLDGLYNSFTFSTEETMKVVTESFDNGVNSLLYGAESAQQQASGKLASFSDDFRDNIYKVGVIAIDILRKAIVSLDDSLSSATAFVVYSYESTKTLLPEESKNVLKITEEKATGILKPVGSALNQVFITVELLERSVGLDPTDPLVPFIIFLGTSATLGISYWLVKYVGYAGDLSPELTLELLKNEEGTVLIDVRPEDLREAEGIPDLRRGARFKYASVTIPKMDGSAKRLLRSVKDIDDALLAVIIRNLKMVQDRSKVIIMDAHGEQSKGIARSLRKLGVKKCYLVEGGFQSWVKNGLRIKQLKPETTFTILNEEAEAILDDIKPTPTLIITYGLGAIATIYALLEWERTLQFIGIIGLGQTLYRRVASYEDSEDFKQDVRLLLAPLSWAAGKLEPTKIGLPTSPSSASVQDRVLQAVAKHESQPSDADDLQNQSFEPTSQGGGNLDVSEA